MKYEHSGESPMCQRTHSLLLTEFKLTICLMVMLEAFSLKALPSHQLQSGELCLVFE